MSYSPIYPSSVALDDGIKQFIVDFYTTSDTKGQDQEWTDFFHDNGTLVMGKGVGKGKAEIKALREGLWKGGVTGRKHSIVEVFPASFPGDEAGATQVMLSGSVDRFSESGETTTVAWAGHMKLKKNAAGQWKFTYYRVWLQM